MPCSALGSVLRRVNHASLCAVIVVSWLLTLGFAQGQPSVLVATQTSVLSIYDLPLQNLMQTIPGSYITFSIVIDPGNPRLAYVGAATYISVFDLTIGREVNRIYGVNGTGFTALASNGRYLLLADNPNGSLDVIDVTRQTLARRVSLRSAMGTGAQGALGSIVVVGSKAYVTTMATDPARPAIAVVDLNTFRVMPIRLPSPGKFPGCCFTTPNAGVIPDQSSVVMAQTNRDGSNHLFFISTANNQVVLDKPQNSGFAPFGIVISPVNNQGGNFGYLLTQTQAVVIDLNIGSQTFGQQLPHTTPVDFHTLIPFPTAAAISPDGSKVVFGGNRPWTTTPNPNVFELDTGLMITNSTSAIVGQTVANGGVRVFGLAVAPITTTPPPSAPTVATVTGSITNDVPNTITLTGANFQTGATVRVGTMAPLPATVTSPTTLTATVPQNAPAQTNLDVVVTNPVTAGPRSQQYQSGLLPAGLTIQPNPAFQPQNQFAEYRLGARAVAVYEPTQATMIDNHTGSPPVGITFNADGAAIYGPSYGPRGAVTHPQVAQWDPTTAAVTTQIPLPVAGNALLSQQVGPNAIAASVNPATGTAVVFVPVRTVASGIYDVVLEMVDTDPSSGTYNTVLSSIPAGLNSSDQLSGAFCAATPNGKYVYAVGQDTVTLQYALIVFDIVHGNVTVLPVTALGVSSSPSFMQVTADGQSLLISGFSGNSYAGPIAVLDIGQQPTNPVLVTTIAGTAPSRPGGAGAFNFSSFQAVGTKLYGLSTDQVVTFNFDRSHSNFSQLGTYQVPTGSSTLAASPDGALVYVANSNYDLIAALDASELATGQSPLITTIGAFPGSYQVTVSPAPINANQLQVATTSLPSGTQGVAYSSSLSATGGIPPYVWTLNTGSLPAGLTLNPYGTITGTPAGSVGMSSFTLTVTDSKGHTAPSGSLGISIVAGATLQVTTSNLPSGPVNQPYYAGLSASGGVPPFSWTISAGSLPSPLTLSNAGGITGTPTAVGTSNFIVKVTDSASPTPNTATAPLSILINAGGNAVLLSGKYAIQLNGFSSGSPWTAIFAIVADGNGNITSGEFDFNQVNQTPTFGQITSGFYVVESTGLGLMTLNTSLGRSVTLSFVLPSNGSGRIVEYDDTTGTGSRASGVIRLRTASAFNLASINGPYAFGVRGFDPQGNTVSEVGEFASDGFGHVTNGLADVNDGGFVATVTFTGSLGSVDSFGRAVLNINGSFGTNTEAVYIVAPAELLFVDIDSAQVRNTPLINGTALTQVGFGSFNNSSLHGTSVVTEIGNGGGGSKGTLGLVNMDGAGHFLFQGDSSQGGSYITEYATGLYSVSPNGRVTLGAGAPIFYLVSTNTAFVLDTDGSAQSGSLEPQAAGPFTNASILGTYSGGNLLSVDPNIKNTVGVLTSDGNGNIVYSQNTSGPSGIGQGQGHLDTLNVSPSGRGTTHGSTILYIVSPNKAIVMGSSIEVYEH